MPTREMPAKGSTAWLPDQLNNTENMIIFNFKIIKFSDCSFPEEPTSMCVLLQPPDATHTHGAENVQTFSNVSNGHKILEPF